MYYRSNAFIITSDLDLKYQATENKSMFMTLKGTTLQISWIDFTRNPYSNTISNQDDLIFGKILLIFSRKINFVIFLSYVKLGKFM